jgi:magnesium chelatase family protein
MGRQLNRQGQSNAKLVGQRLHEVCAAGEEAWKLLEQAVDRFAMSARAHQRIWRLARTIADLADARSVSRKHVSEALTFRYRDAMGR